MAEAEKAVVASAPITGSIGNEAYFSDLDFSKVEHGLEVMLRAGVHFGHVKARRHPKMDDYIYTTRNGINIFDLQKTDEQLKQALEYLAGIRKSGKQILFVATKKQARDLTRHAVCGGAVAWWYVHELPGHPWPRPVPQDDPRETRPW